MLQGGYCVDDYLTETQVFEWCRRFKKGREEVNDDERADRPIEAITKDNNSSHFN